MNRQRFGKNMHVDDCIKRFHDQIQLGLVMVCSCCHQTWFTESVLKMENTKLDDGMKSK